MNKNFDSLSASRELVLDSDYVNFLQELKSKLIKTQIKASIAVNIELIQFYWSLGQDISNLQSSKKWGAKFLKIFLYHKLHNTYLVA